MFKYIMTNTISIFSNLPNDLIMNIIEIETKRAIEEKKKEECKEDYEYVLNQMTELNRWMEEDYERDDMDKWEMEKISLDYWGRMDILSFSNGFDDRRN